MVPVYGVKRSSVLNKSRYFNVIEGLDLDIMHDQLEGVLPLEVKMLIRKVIQVYKLITLDNLNERIATFNYGPIDQKNKPSPLKQQIFSSDAASISQNGTVLNFVKVFYTYSLTTSISRKQDLLVFSCVELCESCAPPTCAPPPPPCTPQLRLGGASVNPSLLNYI